MQTSSQQTSSLGSEFSALKNGWVVVAVTLGVFLTYDAVTGLHSGKWIVAVVTCAGVLAGEVLCRLRPNRSVLETNLVLALLTLALAIPVIAIIQLLH